MALALDPSFELRRLVVGDNASSRPAGQPSIWMNKTTMDRYRPEMRKYYFDSTRYKTYMDQMAAQFGIKYPTIKDGATQ